MLLERITRELFARLGSRYVIAWPLLQVPAAIFVVCGVIAVLASYYNPPAGDIAILLAGAAFFTTAGVSLALAMQAREFRRLMAWRDDPEPSEDATLQAWDLATNLPMRTFRSYSLWVNAIAAVPSVALIMAVLGLPWHASFVLLLVSVPTAGYATILNYSIAEFLMKPVIAEIAIRLPERFEFARNGLPIRTRLVISLPIFTALTGIIVSSLVTDGGGTDLLLAAVGSSIVVGIALSGELTVLLSHAITRPIAELSAALARVREGDYAVRVPIVSSDEMGELSHDFNRMAQGLAEREQIRDAFGTYMDREVAELVLSGQFPVDGVDVEVSIMFCDVPGFTSYAERAQAPEVVAALNELFSATVPIIDRHGGHVDKFLGDGLLAVFGAPEGFADHADRAVAAGLDIVAELGGGQTELQLRVGINSGHVIAGSIGGAGRLNFSVIGDAVNIAARVEAATRDTGDEILITRATRDLLQRPVSLSSRGSIALKGKSEPCEVFAPDPSDGKATADRVSSTSGDQEVR